MLELNATQGSDGWGKAGGGGLRSCFTALSLWECVSLKDGVLVSLIQDAIGGGGGGGGFILFMQKASTYSLLTPHALEISLYRTKFIPLYFIEGNTASDMLSRLKSNNEINLIVAVAIMFEYL